ncbi:glycosyltransferase [Sodalis sp. RH15]|uniref:glycosyltransferase n=1 Tax=Sodalis sp. RH15 TaxID=3394330 RepID=UPI0039B612FF
MKVLHVAETIKGGVATVMRQLVTSQLADKDLTNVKCLIPKQQVSELEGINQNNIYFYNRTGRNFSSLIRLTINFIKVLLTYKPEIIHLHSTFSGAICRIVLFFARPIYRPKIIYCPHGFSFLMKNTELKNKIYINIEKYLSFITEKIICVSQFEAEAAKRAGLDPKKIVLIYNGIKPVFYEKNYNDDFALNLLFIGRLDFQKGIDILEKAMQLLPEDKFKLIIIGDSENGKREKLIKKNIIYKGWLKNSEIVEYLQQADALVIPSRWEGFAMVPLEAMNYSLPIIASDSTSLIEVVKENETGLFFENENENSLASIILSLDKRKLQQFGKAGNNFFLKNFTDDRMIDLTNQLYKIN